MNLKLLENEDSVGGERLLTRQEVAELTRLSYHTLAHWGRRGEGPEFIKVGRRALYRKSGVISWLNEKGKRN